MLNRLSSQRIKLLACFFLLGITVASCINPIYPNEQFLQHAGTLAVSSILLVDLKRDRLSLGAFLAVATFILIHVVGARWIYSMVPYQDWFEAILPGGMSDFLSSDRNHYDRFVHLSFGVLFFPFLFEVVHRRAKQWVFSVVLAWASIQAFSAFYEIFEWGLTVLVSPESADRYNGQQGDIWDAQKDMALAMLGSTLIGAFYGLRKKRLPR